jgi:hypothetical protein
VDNFGIAEQSFGGNTAPVQTDAADVFSLDDCNFQSQLRSANGGNITTWSAADDNEVIYAHKNTPLFAFKF